MNPLSRLHAALPSTLTNLLPGHRGPSVQDPELRAWAKTPRHFKRAEAEALASTLERALHTDTNALDLSGFSRAAVSAMPINVLVRLKPQLDQLKLPDGCDLYTVQLFLRNLDIEELIAHDVPAGRGLKDAELPPRLAVIRGNVNLLQRFDQATTSRVIDLREPPPAAARALLEQRAAQRLPPHGGGFGPSLGTVPQWLEARQISRQALAEVHKAWKDAPSSPVRLPAGLAQRLLAVLDRLPTDVMSTRGRAACLLAREWLTEGDRPRLSLARAKQLDTAMTQAFQDFFIPTGAAPRTADREDVAWLREQRNFAEGAPDSTERGRLEAALQKTLAFRLTWKDDLPNTEPASPPVLTEPRTDHHLPSPELPPRRDASSSGRSSDSGIYDVPPRRDGSPQSSRRPSVSSTASSDYDELPRRHRSDSSASTLSSLSSGSSVFSVSSLSSASSGSVSDYDVLPSRPPRPMPRVAQPRTGHLEMNAPRAARRSPPPPPVALHTDGSAKATPTDQDQAVYAVPPRRDDSGLYDVPPPRSSGIRQGKRGAVSVAAAKGAAAAAAQLRPKRTSGASEADRAYWSRTNVERVRQQMMPFMQWLGAKDQGVGHRIDISSVQIAGFAPLVRAAAGRAGADHPDTRAALNGSLALLAHIEGQGNYKMSRGEVFLLTNACEALSRLIGDEPAPALPPRRIS